MNWRTDKPTADVIVAYVDRKYLILRKYAGNYYTDNDAKEFVPFYKLVKWADLKEKQGTICPQKDETVTNCHQLEEEIDRAIDNLEGVAEKDADGVLIAHLTLIEHLKDFARHFAKWGAEHLKK